MTIRPRTVRLAALTALLAASAVVPWSQAGAAPQVAADAPGVSTPGPTASLLPSATTAG